MNGLKTILFFGGLRGRWGHWGQRGHTNLKTMINDSTENKSLYNR
jgi:hypothetical protein